MVLVLPIVLLLLAVGLLIGQTSFFVLLPMFLALGAGGVVVGKVLREGRPKRGPSVRQLPTDHLRRQMYLALRPNRRSTRQQRREEESE
jgi:hypothetical protein